MFLAFPLYVAYSALFGIFAAVSVALGFRAGFCFSAGATDLLFSAALPAAAKTWLILPLGIAAFVVFYGVFRFAIVKWNLKTPGREEAAPTEVKIDQLAEILLNALGGSENILALTHCITRLRLELKDPSLVDESKIQSCTAGLIRPSQKNLQIILGPKVQFVYDALKNLTE
jgi:PTS system N-acetylglucosamine-specific IIC component